MDEQQPSTRAGRDGISVAEDQNKEKGEEGLNGQAEARTGSSPNFIGKHRMSAAISHLHNQINIIQEELDKLETYGEASIVCKEFISSVDSNPDPLLPETKGPVDVGWDRWFGGAPNSRNHKRWI
ncbi:guanine nucleotide-binding protein subunit gamma 2-like [Quillaja saponaria]|uniref:Guanine nucleotide-binding protein subunit gamma 2-like n=1 Tax=Quillaja saponaria TaxID=32244 RepID=A0AAD7PSA1_QUISA|nr:guanine nucleotide-binding protein subunit gamma 2-like [Quillaja saponaria]